MCRLEQNADIKSSTAHTLCIDAAAVVAVGLLNSWVLPTVHRRRQQDATAMLQGKQQNFWTIQRSPHGSRRQLACPAVQLFHLPPCCLHTPVVPFLPMCSAVLANALMQPVKCKRQHRHASEQHSCEVCNEVPSQHCSLATQSAAVTVLTQYEAAAALYLAMLYAGLKLLGTGSFSEVSGWWLLLCR